MIKQTKKSYVRLNKDDYNLIEYTDSKTTNTTKAYSPMEKAILEEIERLKDRVRDLEADRADKKESSLW